MWNPNNHNEKDHTDIPDSRVYSTDTVIYD